MKSQNNIANEGIVAIAPKNSRRSSGVPWAVAVPVFLLGVVISCIVGMRLQAMTTSSNTADFSSLNEVYSHLVANYDGKVDKAKLIDGAKHGMVDALGDPYTAYFNADEAKGFNGDLNGTFEGIGAEIGKIDGLITVMAVLNDSPAKNTGLKAKDSIIAINDEQTAGMTVGQAVQKIRGNKGTTVKLTIARDGASSDISITRDTVSTPSVTSEILKNGTVGYLRVSRFGDDTASKARTEALKLKQAGVKSILLDLRGNGGGYVTAAQDLAGLWLNNQVVVTERVNGEVKHTYQTGTDAPLSGMKTVILVDGGSASASEIVSLALSEYGVATLVGEKTYGKGTMQVVDTLSNGDELKVTVARWYSPKGTNIDKKGIMPQKSVAISQDDVANGRDPQKDAALESL